MAAHIGGRQAGKISVRIVTVIGIWFDVALELDKLDKHTDTQTTWLSGHVQPSYVNFITNESVGNKV